MAAATKVQAHVSSKGQIVIPKTLRDAKGLGVGSVLEVVDHPEGILLKTQPRKKYTLDDLLNVLPPYTGPPITDEMMQERMDEAMRERWARKEKNSHP
jgi:AbrB family looped-hinge helix DNA binding protein